MLYSEKVKGDLWGSWRIAFAWSTMGTLDSGDAGGVGNLDVDIVGVKGKLPLANEMKITAKEKRVSGVNRQSTEDSAPPIYCSFSISLL